MLRQLKERAKLRRIAAELYGAIVAAAREPALFRDLGVPDSPMGRLESILLHLALVIDRLQAEGAPGQALAQALAEAYVSDMDDCLREIGIGDMGVPRRVKQAAGALYERHRTYAAALAASDDSALGRDLARHLLERDGETASAELIGYVRHMHSALARQEASHLLAGEIVLLPPASR